MTSENLVVYIYFGKKTKGAWVLSGFVYIYVCVCVCVCVRACGRVRAWACALAYLRLRVHAYFSSTISEKILGLRKKNSQENCHAVGKYGEYNILNQPTTISVLSTTITKRANPPTRANGAWIGIICNFRQYRNRNLGRSNGVLHRIHCAWRAAESSFRSWHLP